MSYSRRSRYSPSLSPINRYSRSLSRSLSRSRSRSRSLSRDVENPGNNLYVTGLSPRITKRELEKHFAEEGTVVDVNLVVDPWTRESRGFGFVTMSSVKEAERCIKYLNRSVLESRVITVEKAKRRRGRTPTPGKYLGLRSLRGRRWSHSDSSRRSPSYSPYSRSLSRSRSPGYSSERSRSRSHSPGYRRRRSYSPYSYSRRRSYSRSHSPVRDRSYSPYGSRHYSPDDRYYRRHRHHASRSPTPPRWRRSRRYSRSISPTLRRSSRRSYSRSISPLPRRSRRGYESSISPSPRRSRRSYSPTPSPAPRRSSRRSYSRSISPLPKKGYSKHGRDRYSRSRSISVSSRSVSRSVTPESSSPSR